MRSVRHVFENWSDIRDTLQCNADEPATTDWVYAYVAHLMGEEHTTLPVFTDMSMIHMKQFINTMPTENWMDTLVYEIQPETLRVTYKATNVSFSLSYQIIFCYNRGVVQ